jgi:uncharacterized phage protein (TIGR01671 family)
MREIKFRAWDIENRKMLEVINFSTHFVVVSPDNDDDEGNYSYDLEHKLYNDGSGEIEAFVMQYTGLKDCNGVEIYHMDIVDGENEIFLVIKDERLFETGYRLLCIASRSHIEVGEAVSFSSWMYPDVTLKVIGNIYDGAEGVSSKQLEKWRKEYEL